MRTLIVGQGGRESALAWRMAESSQVFAFMGHENPSLIKYTADTGGKWTIGNVLDPDAVAAFAVGEKIDLAMVSADDPLAAGVIDALLRAGIASVGPTRSGAEIEWNKTFGREILEKIAPQANPFYRVARSKSDIDAIFSEVGNLPLAIKPVGLTGGKGVKVMGPHLADTNEAKAYASEIIESGIGGSATAIIEERITGVEFTIQAITDGHTVICPPATYDYPYRFEGDTGPGTGGMGAYLTRSKNLPFMTSNQYEKACDIVEKTVQFLTEQGRHFNGVLNSGFFITNQGDLKVIEFNARFGDPECMNIMSVIDANWVGVMHNIANQSLQPSDIAFKNACSTVVYLVSPDYGSSRRGHYQFYMDTEAIEKSNCQVFFSSARQIGEKQFETVGSSRCVAVAATGASLVEAHKKISQAINANVRGPLEWRTDIGTESNIQEVKKILGIESKASASLLKLPGSGL